VPQGVAVIRRLVVFTSLALLLVLSAAVPAAARSAPMTLGVSTPDGRNMTKLDNFIAEMGGHQNRPRLWSVWSQWGHRGGKAECQVGLGSCAFPTATLEALDARDISAVVWWEPINPSKPLTQRFSRHKKTYQLKRNDQYITEWALAAKAFGQAHAGRKTVIRFAHEANGTWFPWAVGVWDNTPYTFKKFWRYVYNKFKAAGALPYVDFLWSVAKKACNSCNPFAKVFPGNQYIDYAGVTAFNWGAYKGKGWKSTSKILTYPMKQIKKLTRKPVIVSEYASHFKPFHKSKATWIKSGYNKIYDKFPRIKGVLYLDTDQPKQQWGHPDWRLVRPGNGSALAAYKTISAKPKFQGELP
jgi:hypothetical protein